MRPSFPEMYDRKYMIELCSKGSDRKQEFVQIYTEYYKREADSLINIDVDFEKWLNLDIKRRFPVI